jgi:hypothetical protein
MFERQPEPWESGAAGPCVTLERAGGTVEVWALGEERFSVRAPGLEQVAVGHDSAREKAYAFARELEEPGGR